MFSPKTMRETRQERSECAYSNINLFVYINVREERGEEIEGEVYRRESLPTCFFNYYSSGLKLRL
jgi:hypothetical protein